MLIAIKTSPTEYLADDVWADVGAVCRRIPPLWDLENYVAVNPFLGFAEQPLAEAARVVADGLGGNVLPGLGFYRERWDAGAFSRSDLALAAARAGQDPALLEAILTGASQMPLRPAAALLTCAEQHDRQHGTAWHAAVIRHVALWCGVSVPKGLARWGRPGGAGLYASWREAAMVDRTLEIEGLAGWRDWVRLLPATPREAIAAMLAELAVPPADRAAYLYRLLGGVFGWASYLRRDAWAAGGDDPGAVAELLAIRICADAAVARLAPRAGKPHAQPAAPAVVEEESVRQIFQDALEDGYARRLLGALNPPAAARPAERPALQAVFCIDVRSEVIRRHLEAQAPAIETLGFAGFFGVSMAWRNGAGDSARCPVLLQPAVAVQCLTPAAPGVGKGLLKELPGAPVAAFSFVETLGLAYGIGLVCDALGKLRAAAAGDGEGGAPFELEAAGGIPVATRVELAAGILKNMGLRERFARLIMLCGHESHSENNPHAAGLDCGACGGHGGAINARVAAAVLNDPTVRAELAARGARIPFDTWFLPAVHNTAVDEVTLLDTAQVPASHSADLAALRGWLAQACRATRAERAPGLGMAAAKPNLLERLLKRRSENWSEVRTEWALARNAAFIAARRGRTRGVDLGGRAFLHEYDWTTDPDNSILTLILVAPVVVASWINLQYFASTVDNDTFGCGTKTIHNRIGSLGVVLGNGGDLRTGLPLQSVQGPDGKWYHEPMRLQVVVEAPRERIEAVLAAHPQVAALVANGWIRLFALDPESQAATQIAPSA
jgi:uncharacterized protein YbcC (UPF0753/DUF2309 family)